MKLSLLNKILIALGIITAASLLLVWMVVRPKYEAAVLAERLSVIQQFQKSTLDDLDHAIAGWSHIPRFIISQVTEKPNEGETILRMMMTLHPEIIQIRIHSSGPSDELRSQNTSYPMFNLQISDSVWVHSKVDSALHIAWLSQTELPAQIFALQTQFQVRQIPFMLTVVWDAKRLNDILAGFPFDKDYSVSIHSSSGVITQNASSFKLDGVRTSIDTLSTVQIVHEGTRSWRIFTSALQSAQLWMVVAVPEEIFTKPVADFLLYSAALIVGLMLIMAILGWLVSHQMKRFIEKMKTSTGTAGE
ncbi:MAG: hypothetical protein ABSA44_13590 [Bacteroidota bacterium]|jgi:hypothetical protein